MILLITEHTVSPAENAPIAVPIEGLPRDARGFSRRIVDKGSEQ
jgi:hypothetical protein